MNGYIPPSVEAYANWLAKLTGWPVVISADFFGRFTISAAGRGPEGKLG